MTQYLLFDAGGLNFAAPAEFVKTIHEQLTIQPVAGTCSWFRGLAVAHGKLLPVTDMGAFAGRRSSTGRTLELDPSASIAGLQVDSVYGLSHQDVEEIPLNDAEMATNEVGNLTITTGAIVTENRIHRILDIGLLVQSSEFQTITNQA